jgi:hypothetical protein
MNPPSTLYAILQVMAIFLIFLSAFLALFLCMMLCLVAAELSSAGVSFVRRTIAKRASVRQPLSPGSESQTHAAPRGIGIVH